MEWGEILTVTVLMSTYNGEKYLAEQIESIRCQTYNDINLIVRDDGSSDKTVDILKHYKDEGALTWYSGINLGPGRSFFDLVISSPPSDFYAFADQDDVWDTDKIEIAIKNINAADTDLPVMYCSSVRPVDSNLNVLFVKDEKKEIRPTFGLALTECIAAGCTFVFNKKALEEFREFKSEYVDIHDWALYRIIMALDGVVIYDDTPHVAYRQHGNNAIGFSTRGVKKWIERYKRLKDKKNDRKWSIFAKHIKEIYYEELSEKNKKTLNVLAEYDTSLIGRIDLAFSKDIYMSYKSDSLIFSVLAILGLV